MEKSQGGFTLTEVLVALLLISGLVLGLVSHQEHGRGFLKQAMLRTVRIVEQCNQTERGRP